LRFRHVIPIQPVPAQYSEHTDSHDPEQQENQSPLSPGEMSFRLLWNDFEAVRPIDCEQTFADV
jgi:hypothetical protein